MLKVLIALAFLALNLFLTPTIAISFIGWFTDYTPPGFWQTAGLLLTVRFFVRGTGINDYQTQGTSAIEMQGAQTIGLLALWGTGYLVSLGAPA